MMSNKYDAGEIIAEIRRKKALNTFWAVWPLVSAFALGAFTVAAWAGIVWFAAQTF